MAHTIRAAQKPTNGKRKCSVMNRKKKRIKPELEYAKDSFLNNPVASATECTGYVQNIPDDEYEAESYGALYDVPVSSLDGGEADPPAR